MKIILDITENSKASSFINFIKSLDYIKVLKEIKGTQKGRAIEDLVEAFNDVKLHEKGKKKLRSAKDLLNEL